MAQALFVKSNNTYEDCEFVFATLLANGVSKEMMKEALDEAIHREQEYATDASCDAAEAAILAAKHAEEMCAEITESILENTKLIPGAPEWTPEKQYTKELWNDWRQKFPSPVNFDYDSDSSEVFDDWVNVTKEDADPFFEKVHEIIDQQPYDLEDKVLSDKLKDGLLALLMYEHPEAFAGEEETLWIPS